MTGDVSRGCKIKKKRREKKTSKRQFVCRQAKHAQISGSSWMQMKQREVFLWDFAFLFIFVSGWRFASHIRVSPFFSHRFASRCPNWPRPCVQPEAQLCSGDVQTALAGTRAGSNEQAARWERARGGRQEAGHAVRRVHTQTLTVGRLPDLQPAPSSSVTSDSVPGPDWAFWTHRGCDLACFCTDPISEHGELRPKLPFVFIVKHPTKQVNTRCKEKI